jgi:hypothetical protein
LRKALATGKPWGKLHFDLAYTLARIDQAERGDAIAPAGDQRAADILHHLRQAHQLGVDLRQHGKNFVLRPWLQRLPPAVAAAAPPPGIPEPPLVLDPLRAKDT